MKFSNWLKQINENSLNTPKSGERVYSIVNGEKIYGQLVLAIKTNKGVYELKENQLSWDNNDKSWIFNYKQTQQPSPQTQQSRYQKINFEEGIYPKVGFGDSSRFHLVKVNGSVTEFTDNSFERITHNGRAYELPTMIKGKSSFGNAKMIHINPTKDLIWDNEEKLWIYKPNIGLK